MKVMFVSLGCDKNLVDTENMLGILNDRGFTFTDDEMEAEVIAVNTCCFIHDAKQESINTILEMAEHKKDGKCKILTAIRTKSQKKSRKSMHLSEHLPMIKLQMLLKPF